MIRLKHILIPIIAIATMAGYFGYAQTQAAKFDSDLWKSDYDSREEMLLPLMGYVLKVGQSREEVRDKLGFIIKERTMGCCVDPIFCEASMITEVYEVSENTTLTVIYSIDQKVTDFYSGPRPYLFIF